MHSTMLHILPPHAPTLFCSRTAEEGDITCPEFTESEITLLNLAARHIALLLDASEGVGLQ